MNLSKVHPCRRPIFFSIFFSMAIVLLLVSAMPSFAKEPDPAFMKLLYPPELVMQNHRAIGLSKDQRATITKAIGETQAQTVELGWSMQDAAAQLTEEMDRPRVDAKAALETAKEVMAIESQVKRAHLGLLIKIKNALSLEQQRKLDEIRAKGS